MAPKLFWTRFRTKESRDGPKLKNHPENLTFKKKIITSSSKKTHYNSVEVRRCTTLVELETKLEVVHLPTIDGLHRQIYRSNNPETSRNTDFLLGILIQMVCL
jgi:hypothetical protein